MASLTDGGAFGPGRRAELTAFVEEALAQFLDPAADGAAVAPAGVRRLAERAPFDEVVPSLFALVARAR